MSNQKKRNEQISYYHAVFGRPDKVKEFFRLLFLMLSYVFRVPIEIITRREIGVRYFNLLLTVAIGIAFVGFPVLVARKYGSMNWGLLFEKFSTWYLYTGLYLYSAYRRLKEIRRRPSIWVYPTFTKYEGDPMKEICEIKIDGAPISLRLVSLVVEPGIFFAVGVILALFLQPIGFVFIVCAIIYSLGYHASYGIAEDYIMDVTDKAICNEQLARRFMNDERTGNGFSYEHDVPADPDLRERMYREMTGDDTIDVDHEDVK